MGHAASRRRKAGFDVTGLTGRSRYAMAGFCGEDRLSILGTRVLRSEDPQFLTTGATYTEDLVDERLAGALHATFVRSPIAAATIVSIDASAALEAPGVVAVFTADDIDDVPPPGPAVPDVPGADGPAAARHGHRPLRRRAGRGRAHRRGVSGRGRGRAGRRRVRPADPRRRSARREQRRAPAPPRRRHQHRLEHRARRTGVHPGRREGILRGLRRRRHPGDPEPAGGPGADGVAVGGRSLGDRRGASRRPPDHMARQPGCAGHEALAARNARTRGGATAGHHA